MKKSVKISLIILSAAIVASALVFSLLKFPSAETDHKVFGEKFEENISEKYTLFLVGEVPRVEDREYRRINQIAGGMAPDSDLIITGYMDITDIKDRNIYCTIPAKYYGTEYLVKFKGTKVIGNKYTWEVMECDYTRAVVEHLTNGDYEG